MMKVAIVYDRVNKWGGAERVLLTLHEMFPEAPLYTSVYNPQKAPWVKVFPEVKTSCLQKFPLLRNRHELLGVLMPIAFESFDFTGYDLVISVTSEAAKGVLTKPPTKHLCMMLTPTRYLWSHYDDYFKGSTFKGVSRPAVGYLRWWDTVAANRPDKIIAISKEVQSRIKKYYQRSSMVVYPPVEIGKSVNCTTPIRSGVVKGAGDYFLVVSRLVAYKRVDLVIKAFNRLGRNLVIVGTGREEYGLKSKSKNNIFFAGFVSDEELIGLYRGAKALIMPQVEDFGLVSVEAQAVGTPVIAYAKGGALDTVVDGKTGIFFYHRKVDSLIDAVKRFDRMKFSAQNLFNNAKRFSKDNFKKKLVKVIKSL